MKLRARCRREERGGGAYSLRGACRVSVKSPTMMMPRLRGQGSTSLCFFLLGSVARWKWLKFGRPFSRCRYLFHERWQRGSEACRRQALPPKNLECRNPANLESIEVSPEPPLKLPGGDVSLFRPRTTCLAWKPPPPPEASACIRLPLRSTLSWWSPRSWSWRWGRPRS